MTEWNEDLTDEYLEELANQVASIHQDTNIDGYGDEGAGYDYKKQVRLLIEEGWIPPAPETQDNELTGLIPQKIVVSDEEFSWLIEQLSQNPRDLPKLSKLMAEGFNWDEPCS